MPATGPELATAYVSISASTGGLGKGIAKALGSSEVSRAGDAAGKSISSRLGSVLKKGALATGAAVSGLVGTSLVKGFKRLNAIDQAEAKLRGLGHSAKQVQGIMGNALSSVKGTAFGLDEAATTAGAVVAAGIKPGKELTSVLKTTADTATIAGTSMSDMGAIFGSVAARGKLQGDDLMQLTSRGVPVLAFLAKHYGTTAKAASKMVTEGKVDFKNFAAAMKENIGGAALDSGKTVQGSWKNLWASVSRIGANALSGIFPKLQKAFVGLTDFLGPVEDKAADFGKKVGSGIKIASDAIKTFVNAFRGKGEVGGKWMVPLVEAGVKARNIFDTLKDAVSAAFDYISNRVLPVVVSGFKGLWDAAKPILPALKNIGGALLGILKGAGTSAADSGPGILATAFTILKGAVSGVAKVLGWVGDFAKNHTTTFQALAVGVLAIVGAMKAWTIATRVWQAVTKVAAAVQAAFNAVMAANPIGIVVLALVGLAAGLVYAYKKSETFRKIVNGAFSAVKSAASAVRDWFTKKLVPFFTKTLPGAFRATVSWVKAHWPAILSILTGPIGAATIYVVRHWGQIKGAFSDAWKWVKGAFKSAWNGVKSVVMTPIEWARDKVKDIFGANGPVRGAFSAVKDWVGGVFKRDWAALKLILTDPVQAAKNVIRNLFGKDGPIRGAFSGALSAIGGIWEKLPGKLTGPVNSAVRWLKDHFVGPIASLLDKVGLGGLASGLRGLLKLGSGGTVTGYSVKGLTHLAGGGVIPGPWRGPKADNILGLSEGGVPVARVNPGEFITNVAATRSMERNFPGALGYINATGRLPGYGIGGLVKSAWGSVKSAASSVWDAIDPVKRFKELAGKLLGDAPEMLWGRVAFSTAQKAAAALAGKIKGSLFGGPGGPLMKGPHIGGSWQGLWNMVHSHFPGAILTSAYRPGARTPFGNLSRHALGKAIDIAPSKAIWDWLLPMRGRLFELLGPWGMYRMGKPWYSPITAAMHKNHIHLSSYADGGTVRPRVFDQGGVLAPGLNLVRNDLGRPEHLVRADQRERQIVINGNVGWQPAELLREANKRDKLAMAAAGGMP